MSYLGSWKIDDYLTFCCNTHDPDTGVATDADSVPTYRVYEDETATPILTGSTALLDTANTAGFYSQRIQLTAANGFEKGKCYTIYITATVDSDAGTMHHNFQMEAEVDANTASDLHADLDNGGRLDLLIDAIKAVTDALPDSGALNDLATILADTNELQTDDVPTLIAALPTAAENVNEWETQSQADPTGFHVNTMESLSQPVKFDSLYGGLAGPGVWIDAGANTNTVSGVDGIPSNPVSTLTAARTIADALGYKTYYLLGGVSLTIAATHEDWHFIGLGEPTSNRINLGSQDVDRSAFVNLEVVGVQGGTERIIIRGGAINDPGAGATTLHVFACATMFTGDFELDTSNDNIFDQCFSGVAGAAAPIITATGAAGTAVFRHYSGGIEFKALSASHNISCETDGQVIFNADCNVNATVALRGNMTITDNTAGMNSLSRDAALNGAYINVQADTAITDYDPPTNAEMDTGHGLLATEAKQDIIDTVVDTILADTAELQTDDYPTSIAAIKAETALIVADTNELQTDDTPAAIAALNDLSAAQVNAEVDTALADIHLDHLLAADYDPASKPGVATALLNEVVENDGGVSRFTENALEQAPSGTGASAATIADAVLDEILGDHDTEDSLGNVLNDLTEEPAGTYRFTEAALAQGPAGSAGAGAITFTYTLTSTVDSAPIASATVWVTTDQAGTNVVASGTTDTNGDVTFYLDAGTYYVWREKSGWNFTNPDTEAVA